MSSAKMVWVDIETTGLDPLRDVILEIGLRVTNVDLDTIADREGILGDAANTATGQLRPYGSDPSGQESWEDP